VDARAGSDDDPAGLLQVGRVIKPHGIRGEVIVDLWSDRVERLAVDSVLHSAHGELVVRASRRHQDRWIVHFDGYESRTAAEALRDVVLEAEPMEGEDDELWVHELIGTEVVTVDGTAVGRCVAVVANPAADLLELDSGALVPVVFVVGREAGRVLIDPPEGLLDL